MTYHKTYLSKIGKIHLKSDGEYLTGLWFEDSPDENKHKEEFTQKDLPIFEETIHYLEIYFKGEKPNFTPKYRIENLTPFRKMVTDIMLTIPYGKVITYKYIALKISALTGKKMSAQAVGGAVGANPICIIVPCHRVVGADNNLTGYGGGIQNKIALLEVEGNDISKFKMPKEKKNAKM